MITIKEKAALTAMMECLGSFSGVHGENAINYPMWSDCIWDYAGKETKDVIGDAKAFSGLCSALSQKGFISCNNSHPSEATIEITRDGYSEYLKK